MIFTKIIRGFIRAQQAMEMVLPLRRVALCISA
jgi:hypothetical protein